MLRLGMVELDTRGRLVALRPQGRDQALLDTTRDNASPLLQAWIEGQEQPVSDWCVLPAGENAVVLRSAGEPALEVALDAVPTSTDVRLRAELLNQGRATVQRVRLQFGGPLDIGPGARLTYPSNSGWCVPLASLGPRDLLSLHYPTHASMQWVDLYTEREGFYVGVQDPLPYLKTLLLGRQRGQPFLACEYPHLQLEPGQTFRFPALHLAWHQGDWRAGADLYRAWIAPYIARPDPPAWYRRMPAWNWVGLRGQHEPQPWHRADALPTLSARAAAFGPDLIQLTAYTEHGHDTGYPDYAVGDSLGGAQSARKAVREIHDAGRCISVYVNGRLVDPASSVSAQARRDWGVRAEPEAPVQQETYGQVTFDIMCPGAQDWQRLFISKVAALVRRHGFDGVYIDQVCGAPPLPCYAPSHPHDKPGEAWATYKPFMASLRLALREIKNDLFLATEGVNDLLGQHFDSMQSHEDWVRDMEGRGILLPELYRYTFPHQLLNVGCIRANREQYLFLGHALGSGFDFGISEFDALTPQFVSATRWILAQRARHDHLLRDARLIPLLDADAAGYRANAFAKDGALLVVGAPLTANPAGLAATLQLAVPWPYDRAPTEALASTIGGPVDLPIERREDRLYLALPSDRPSTVLLSVPQETDTRKE